MRKIIEIHTERLLLRQWRKSDLPAFADLNADPVVMKYYPNTLSTQDSNAMANKLEDLVSENGWGLWAVEVPGQTSFIGFVGLHKPDYKLPVSPCVEVGWRLAQAYWGNGYATEAAKASLDIAFHELGFKDVYSFASLSNKKSRAVMERINMVNTGMIFDHPLIPDNSPLRAHALYRIEQQRWVENLV